jgi:hypothetical protein
VLRSVPSLALTGILALAACDTEDVAFRIGPEACIEDLDSDDDGLFDGRECTLGTRPDDADSDRDGVSDLVEVEGAMTDPLDPTSTIADTDIVVTLPYDGAHETRQLTLETRVKSADVFFLVDTTQSMREERDALIGAVQTIVVPGLAGAIEDLHVGVGSVQDYPVNGYGRVDFVPVDSPFAMVMDISPAYADVGRPSITFGPLSDCPGAGHYAPGTRNVFVGTPNGREDLLEALEALPCGIGGDEPDGYVAALWLVASGGTLGWPGGTDAMGSWPSGSIPASVCGDRIGYPCFRPDALPIVVLVGDAPFHEDQAGANRYDAGRIPDAPSWREAADALGSIGARVIGIFAGTTLPDAATRRASFEAIAMETGAVDTADSPLVFDVPEGGGSLIGEAAVDAIETLVTNVAHDVSGEARDAPPNPGDVDASVFVTSITPLDARRGTVVGPSPGVTYTSKDDTTFYAVVPGTTVDFTLDLHNDIVEPGPVTRVYRAHIVILADHTSVLDTRTLYVLVPSA